ncbi:MAG: TetR/AcrR family transcriptional regulator [Pseudomonadales bacterium]
MTTRTPKQSRAIRTVASILDASTRLLTNKGYEGLTTNTVAAEAGINISTLYSYFPNKEAILERLLERYNDQLVDQLQPLLANNPNKNERIGHIIETQAQLMIDEPWIRALKEALVAVPALHELQAHAIQHLINSVLVQIPQEIAGPKKVSGDHQQVVMQLLVDTFNRGALMIAKSQPGLRKAMLAEVKLLINSYLDNYR